MRGVLVVDDSDTARKLLVSIINSAKDMRVIGEAHNGRQAVEMVAKLRPDVVVMDVSMPEMDGMEATQAIMQRTPTPIVIVSSSIEGRETEVAFQAIRLGALTVMNKPIGPGDPNHHRVVDRMLTTIRTMSDVRVIHHRTYETNPRTALNSAVGQGRGIELVAIASSTGGPATLSEILRRLPHDFAYPVVIAQHMGMDFIPSLCNWLGSLTPLTVETARAGETPRPGHVYFAYGETNLTLTPDRLFSYDYKGRTQYVPSGDVLLSSVAQVYKSNAAGVVLTGMGEDGARGLKRMQEAGALTLAQDEASCVVYGMPKEAALLGAAKYVLPPADIAQFLVTVSKKKETTS